MHLSNRIKRLRLKNNLTQANLCKGIISVPHYSNIETGRFSPNIETLELLANRLHIPANYFLAINEECPLTENALTQYEELIMKGAQEEINRFYNNKLDRFSFIPSYKQELYFYLLRFIELVNSNNIREAMNLYEEDIKDIPNIDSLLNSKREQKLHYVSGLYFYFKKQYWPCIQHFKQMISLDTDMHLTSKAYFNMGLAHYKLNDYVNALEHTRKAKLSYFKLHDWSKVGDCYNLMAVLFREMGLPSESESYITRGFDIATSDAYELVAKLNHNLALLKFDAKDYHEATTLINNSISLKLQNCPFNIFNSYKVKLNIFLATKDIIMLKKTLKEAAEFVNNPLEKATYNSIKAKMHYLLEDYPIYEKLISKSIEGYLETSNWKSLILATEHYSTFLEANKKYKKAFEQQRLSIKAYKHLYEGGQDYEKVVTTASIVTDDVI